MNARRLLPALALAVLAILSGARVAEAHPLGNFTINHYAGIVVGRSEISIRWVLDMAEIPAFAARRQIDANRDDAVTPEEISHWLDATLPGLVDVIRLEVNGKTTPLRVLDRNVTFPPGQGGLSTLRLVVNLAAPSPPGAASITFQDTTYPERIGWHEITARPSDGVRFASSDVSTATVSDELRRYPADALTNPVDARTASVQFEPTTGSGRTPSDVASSSSSGSIVRAPDILADLAGSSLTPITAAFALLLALGLGAVHGISPGHGKTLVAAYLIGNRGSLRQAAWLGVTVAATHTVGVFVLGVVTLVATEALLPERIVTWLSLASGLLVVGLGGALLWRAWRSARRHGELAEGTHPHPHPHAHPHPSDHAHDHEHGAGHAAPRLSAVGIAGLGLVGGMVPSASALLVLLVAITTGKIAFGIALIIAFGVGMAGVLAAISASVVFIRRRLDVEGPSRLRHRLVMTAAAVLPVASALVVLAIGLVLSVGAARALG
jgi:ABC-type nickel/cobalt efflux system permease component RcnA